MLYNFYLFLYVDNQNKIPILEIVNKDLIEKQFEANEMFID